LTGGDDNDKFLHLFAFQFGQNFSTWLFSNVF